MTNEPLQRILLNDNRWFDEGVLLISKYKTHRNEVIQTAAEGTILGTSRAKKA